MSERVRLEDAAEILGCSPQCVREHMKRGIWDLGTVVKNKKRGGKRNEYFIFRAKLNALIGRSDNR